jgi:hypothetical protein
MDNCYPYVNVCWASLFRRKWDPTEWLRQWDSWERALHTNNHQGQKKERKKMKSKEGRGMQQSIYSTQKKKED